MKRFFQNFQQNFLRLSIWALVLANAAVLAWSCTKDNPMVLEDPKTTDVRPFPTDETDPLDYIAFINPIERTFYADPEYLPVILDQLDAKPLGTNQFLMSGTAFSGEQVEFPVQLVLTPAPTIAEIANDATKALQTNPDIILEGVDSTTGVPIRIRRNWKCGNTLGAITSQCVNLDNGTSSHTQFLQVSICKKEDGALCPEEWGIWGTKYTYSTKNCTGAPVNAEPQRYWVCK